MYLLNSDGGYSNIKCYDGENLIEIPSLVCNEVDVKVIQDSGDTIDNLIAEVKCYDDISMKIKNVVVGKRAKYSGAKYDFSANKICNDNTIYPTIIAFAY